MKIVYCLNQLDFVGGIERVTIAKANALSKIDGNEVYIIVAFHRGEWVFPVEESVSVIDLDVRYYEDFSVPSYKRTLFMLRKRKEHRRKLETALKEIEPDIVISVGNVEKFLLSRIAVRSNPAFIREFHFHKFFRRVIAENWRENIFTIPANFIDFTIGAGLKGYDKLVVLTEEDRTSNWKGNRKVVVIPNPITIVPEKQATLDNKVVIAAGRLVKQKNFASLISAWKQVAAHYPDWKLKIFGEGVQRYELQRLIDQSGLNAHVSLCGVSRNIQAEMSEASMFVLSSICEGFGLVILEAMSCGLPVVSYACPCGPKDIISEGEDGFLVPVNDEELLAERITTLMADTALRKKMGKMAKIASQRYSMEKITEKWMSLFHTLRNESY